MPAHLTMLHTIAIALDLHDNGNPWLKLLRLAVKQRTINLLPFDLSNPGEQPWNPVMESFEEEMLIHTLSHYDLCLYKTAGVSRGLNISSEVTPLKAAVKC